MQMVTLDAINYLPVTALEIVVLQAIDIQASNVYPDDPQRAADLAKDRKTTVLGAMNGLADYPEDQKAMLLGFLKYWGKS